jgi:hypothetical protein
MALAWIGTGVPVTRVMYLPIMEVIVERGHGTDHERSEEETWPDLYRLGAFKRKKAAAAYLKPGGAFDRVESDLYESYS